MGGVDTNVQQTKEKIETMRGKWVETVTVYGGLYSCYSTCYSDVGSRTSGLKRSRATRTVSQTLLVLLVETLLAESGLLTEGSW
jgi:hypothetical protein